MRPPEFTGGKRRNIGFNEARTLASMRPPEFTGGKYARTPAASGCPSGFNEAAGIHRRKVPILRFGRVRHYQLQ